MVEVTSPPTMMVAIGPSISRPGSPLPSASGSRPSAVTSAVIRIDGRRSAAPRSAVSSAHGSAFDFHQVLVVRHQHDRVAQRDAEQRDETDQRARARASRRSRSTAITPPISANGRLRKVMARLRRLLNAM